MYNHPTWWACSDQTDEGTMFRYSLAGLLFLTVVAGMGCAALFGRSLWWGSAVVSGTLAMLAAAVLLAIYRRHAARAFWLGFTVCGWMYMFIVFGPWFGELQGELLTTRLLSLLEETTHAAKVAGDNAEIQQARDAMEAAQDEFEQTKSLAAMGMVNSSQVPRLRTAAQQAAIDYDQVASKSFYRIGHSLWAWLFAIFGGFVASAARRSADGGSSLTPQESPPASASESPSPPGVDEGS